MYILLEPGSGATLHLAYFTHLLQQLNGKPMMDFCDDTLITPSRVETSSDEQVVDQAEDSTPQMLVLPHAMTRIEALCCLQEIRGFLNSARAKLLEFKERRGWETLNYPHLTACLEDYFPDSRTKLVRELFAAEIERDILQVPIGTCPASHFRSLRKLEPKQYRHALDRAREMAGDSKITAIHVTQSVDEVLNSAQVFEESGSLYYSSGTIVRIKCRPGALPEQKSWDGCWGIVQFFRSISSVQILVGNSRIDYTVKELRLENNTERNFQLNCERIIDLWQKSHLELVEEKLLRFLQRAQSFTDLEIKIISLMEEER